MLCYSSDKCFPTVKIHVKHHNSTVSLKRLSARPRPKGNETPKISSLWSRCAQGAPWNSFKNIIFHARSSETKNHIFIHIDAEDILNLSHTHTYIFQAFNCIPFIQAECWRVLKTRKHAKYYRSHQYQWVRVQFFFLPSWNWANEWKCNWLCLVAHAACLRWAFQKPIPFQ